MPPIDLSPEVQAVVKQFRTGELSSLAKDGTPVTWPITPLYQAEKGRFLITTSIGVPQKAFNIRRNPKVSLLFSDPTACGLVDPPAVLFQGDAVVPDKISTWSDEIEELAWVLSRRQRARGFYSSNPVTRYLFDWYSMRLCIYLTPLRVLWWEHGDFSLIPHEQEVHYVG